MRLSGGGVGTYTRELLRALHDVEDIDIVDVHHDGTDRSSRSGRVLGELALRRLRDGDDAVRPSGRTRDE